MAVSAWSLEDNLHKIVPLPFIEFRIFGGITQLLLQFRDRCRGLLFFLLPSRPETC